MSSAPAMPIFPDAYLADTTHLTTLEHGVYFLLLMAMWRRGGFVPNDDKDLARIVGLELSAWRKMKKRLTQFLTIEGDTITQKRLQKEWQYVTEKRNKNAANGTRGGRPKSNINNRLEKANGYENENPNESPHNPEPIPIEKANAFSGRAGARKKPRGWVKPRNYTDAATAYLSEIESNERRRNENSNEGLGRDVHCLPAIASGGR
mgnify:FL=1